MAVTADEILGNGASGGAECPSPMFGGNIERDESVRKEKEEPSAGEESVAEVSNVSVDNPAGGGSTGFVAPKDSGEVVKRGVVDVANPGASTDRERSVTASTDLVHKVGTSTDEEVNVPVGERQKDSAKKKTYVDLFHELSPYKPPTDEELEKERKKQKREAIFAAIGDGISALSNLYFTTQYAPNAYDASKGMAATTKQRFDRLKKEREDNQRQYMDGYFRAMKMDADEAKDERAWQHGLEREKLMDQWREEAEKRKASREEFESQKRALDLQYLQGKIDRQDYLTEQEKIETEYMRANGMKMPTTPKPSTGSGGGGGKSGNVSTYPAYNPTTGETIYIQAKDSKHAWSQCPEGYTIRQEPSESKSTHTTTDRRGKTKDSKTTKTTKNGNDALHGPQTGTTKKQPNPKGGNGNTKKKKPNPMS